MSQSALSLPWRWAPSDSCSATGTAKAGWYKNLGSAAGSGPQGQPVKASDASSYYGLTPGAVTNSSLCDFGDQFRLIFTPDMKYYTSSNPAYKLSDSNPGQFFYNVFHVSSSQETIQLEIPYPYVTQGANPVHLYGGLSVNQSGGYNCFAPTNELASYASTVTLGSYTDTNTDGKVGYGDVYRVEVPAKLGFQYVNIHLDYGLEKTNGWIKKGSNVTNNPTIYPALTGVAIVDNTPHKFQAKVNGALLNGSADTVYNLNEFKQIRGFGGLVYVKTGTIDGQPVYVALQGAKVGLVGPTGSVLETMTTDGDGWYLSNYIHKGKEAKYTLRLLAGTYLGNPYPQQEITGIAVGGSAKYGEGIFYISPLQ